MSRHLGDFTARLFHAMHIYKYNTIYLSRGPAHVYISILCWKAIYINICNKMQFTGYNVVNSCHHLVHCTPCIALKKTKERTKKMISGGRALVGPVQFCVTSALHCSAHQAFVSFLGLRSSPSTSVSFGCREHGPESLSEYQGT